MDFNVTTKITFFKDRAHIFIANPAVQELEVFQDTLKTCDICAEPVIGRDSCEQDFFHTKNFNEKVFCELISATIMEADIHKNPKSSCKNPAEQTFKTITEKLVLNLTLKILQKQQVKIETI